jgi:hypothetical protein
MRMAGPDIVLFVIGAVLFGGATYAIVSLDDEVGGQTSALGVFDVAWSAQTVEIGSENVANMRSATQEFEVTEERILALHVTVACSDPAGTTPIGFSLQVRVEGPNGTTADGNGPCGSDIVIDIPLGEMPPAMSVAGSTEAQARENPAAPATSPGVGTWTVTVSGARAAQTPIPLPAGDPSGSITLTADVATPSFTPVQR